MGSKVMVNARLSCVEDEWLQILFSHLGPLSRVSYVTLLNYFIIYFDCYTCTVKINTQCYNKIKTLN